MADQKRSPFYLTIPSDKTFSGNRLSNFRVKHNAIHLEGEWQVALAEMIYPVTHYNLSGAYFDLAITDMGGESLIESAEREQVMRGLEPHIPIRNEETTDFKKIPFEAKPPLESPPLPTITETGGEGPLEVGKGEKVARGHEPHVPIVEPTPESSPSGGGLVKRMRDPPRLVRLHLPNKHYSDAAELVGALMLIYDTYWVDRLKVVEAIPITEYNEAARKTEIALIKAAQGGVVFEFNPMEYRIRTTMLGSGVDEVLLNEKLNYAMGYRSNNPLHVGQTVAEYPPDLNVGTQNMFVYTDIIEPQIVGPVMTPLLKIIPIRGAFGDQQVAEFRHLHYVNVLVKDFDTIQFSIKDQTGLDMAFTSGQVIVKLHFRRRTLLM